VEYQSIKVPKTALKRAAELKEQLRCRGTGGLPVAMRPEGELTWGHVFLVGLNVLEAALERANKRRT
jgi:hypothetical protein